MFIVLLLFLLLLLVGLVFLVIKLTKWTFRKKLRVKAAGILFGVAIMGLVVNHFLFKNMRLIQSEVYPNLYLVKYPDKEYSKVQKAIQEKIKEHLQAEHKTGKPLAYRNENGIYFYEYGGTTFGFIGEAGTGYFIDHEEDLGGFVSEELGIYQDYRLAEFYYDSCPDDSTLICGEINYFKEGEFHKIHSLSNLAYVNGNLKPSKDLGKSTEQSNAQVSEETDENQGEKLPLHGILDKEALAKYYPKILNEFDRTENFYSEKIEVPKNHGAIVSLLHLTNTSTDYLLYTHNQNLEPIDAFYIGKATDFDNGRSETIDYKINQDGTIVFNKVVWGMMERNNEEIIDTLAHKTITIRLSDKGNIDYTISKNPEYYVLEAFNMDSDPNGINLRDSPNGTIIKTLKPPEYGYIFSIVRGENGWFRVLKINTVDDGELKMSQGILWIHSSVIGIRANRDAPILDTPQTGKQIGLIPSDKEIKIMDLHRDWVKVEYQGIIGWVDSELLCGYPVSTCP
ncbi:hypothetical protein [Maribacter flavus]|uniref:SH3 domain-containing protein n=1 Tax=Maribacter flavus TaxID=1658664 RepID=A0A5B2TWM9_9FLAO|nr:hypothetical protein [Maribacter flavus]KAA2218814.1 hypothetical protein F0361_04090 [Maribacter flavus]